MSEKILLDSDGIEEVIQTYSRKIYEDVADINSFAIVGVQTRGVQLANRIKRRIEDLSGKNIQTGTLDITFYRDDLATRGVLPIMKETSINFNVNKMIILLVDDVIFTGRSMKAALETLMTFGRPSAIKLFELVDRGNRELPIQPDYCGLNLQTAIEDKVNVLLKETDDTDDRVVLISDD